MNCKLIYLLFYVFSLKREADLILVVRKFVGQKDMSELCRRRAAPSVFLGEQVMEAKSHVMHFSQLDVPYSCSLSIRTEPGNNIILVIEMLSENSLIESCAQNPSQLAVYELGETFGGYWGPVPDQIIKRTPKNYTKYYTLKTTPKTTIKTTAPAKIVTSDHTLKYTESNVEVTKGNFVFMEVPLVNVSGNLQLDGPLRHAADSAEEMFDFIYDVTPRHGEEYKTSLMPLVQFSIKKQNSSFDNIQRYELDYDIQGLTLDPRLTFSTSNKRVTKYKKWSANRQYNYWKRKTTVFARRNTLMNVHKLFPRISSTFAMENNITTKLQLPTLDSKYSTVSWKYIEDLLKSFNTTLLEVDKIENVTLRNVLPKIFNLPHNSSLYLVPNLTIFNATHLDRKLKISNYIGLKEMNFTENNNQSVMTSSNEIKTTELALSLHHNIFSTTNDSYTNYKDSENYQILKNKTIKENSISNRSIMQDLEVTEANININRSVVYTSTVNLTDMKRIVKNNNDINMKNNYETNIYNRRQLTSSPQVGTLVDHVSWENVVQSAPVIADVLNNSDPVLNNSVANKIKLDYEEKNNISKSVKKRNIQCLNIENSRPRNLTTSARTTRYETMSKVTSMQDLARLVEIEDDEIEGRVALRYLRNYVGSTLFNICDFKEANPRQMYLFNTSRIVIVISNFTMDQMMLVLTPTQALLHAAARCSDTQLECQILGTRVCIDDINACDAVPNCGSYDIYDEDRLMCGVAKGLQHNVYLAAFAFLALILTALYTVYYCLQRCVPRVAEAFFVYTEASENSLFLDSIMRSPTDVNDTFNKYVYAGRFSGDELLCNELQEIKHETNFFKKLYKKCLACFYCARRKEKKSSEISDIEPGPARPKRMYSFAQLELRKFTLPLISNEQGVQTSESLEMFTTQRVQQKMHAENKGNKDLNVVHDQEHKHINTDELNVIRLSKEFKYTESEPGPFYRFDQKENIATLNNHNEKELKNIIYDQQPQTSHAYSDKETEQVKDETIAEKPKAHGVLKHLRFDDNLTMIPTMEYIEEENDSSSSERNIRGLGHIKDHDSDKVKRHDGSEPSTSKDFMRFWGSGKSKKSKKKSHLSSRN